MRPAVKQSTEIIFLVLVPLLVFALLGEIVLRVYLSRNLFYDVEMSRYALSLKVDSPNPKIAHHHRPGAVETLMGVEIRTNADGFRDVDYPVARTGARRVVVLGDSLTLGWGVEREETFEFRIERALDAAEPTEVLNLGVGNYDTTQEVHLLIDKGLKYSPDQVVLFYFINDAEPVPRRSRFPGLGHYRIVTFFWSRLKAVRARWSDTPGYLEFYSALYRDGSEGWAATQAALAQLAKLSREAEFDLRVVLLPELHQLDPYAFESQHRKVSDTLHALDVPVLDLAPAFRDVTDPQSLWVSMDDAHPNGRAHAMIAKYSLPFISEGLRGEAP